VLSVSSSTQLRASSLRCHFFPTRRSSDLPVVLKADGLAAGKGVLICDTPDEAVTEFNQIIEGKFGSAGASVVVEQFLSGIEFSRSEEHTSELQSRENLVCRLLLEKKKKYM